MIFIRLFGGASLESDGAILSGPAAQRHRLALLSLLCVSHPQSLSRDKLLGYLWPERDNGHARNLLKQAVHVLRKALGDDVIVSAGDELRLGSPLPACDLLAFEEAIAAEDWERADGLYAGPLLDGFFLGDAPEFEHWLDLERERLRRDWRRALAALAEERFASGNSDGARASWHRLLADDPHDGRATIGLMEALESLGDRGGAIRQARLHELLLAEDFGASPDPAVRAVADRICAGDGGGEPAPRATSRLLSKDGQAGAFAEAVRLAAPTATLPSPPTGRKRRHLVAVSVALIALVLTGILLRPRAAAPVPLDPDLLAVTPFDASAPRLEHWSEGVVDVLSRSLDGAGTLRTVSPSVALSGWRGRSDRASAAALGHRTRAGLVLYGGLEPRGSDSLTIRATLLDLDRGRTVAELEVVGDTLSMAALMDTVALGVLRDLARTRAVGAVRRSPLGARSLPALKAFLRGEQYYRRNLWDSALAQYDRAIARDSGFTLAYRRLRQVLEWNSRASEIFRPPDEAVLRRGAFASGSGLAPRDSLLVLLDSLADVVLYWQQSRPSPPPDYLAQRHRLSATLAEALRRYPGDPEVWYAAGEIGVHAGDAGLVSPGEALRAFEWSIALDSGFAPAYIHVADLAIAADVGDPERARRHLAAYLRLNPADDNTLHLRLIAELLDPARAGLSGTDALIAEAPAGVLFTAAMSLRQWPDSAETGVRLLRRLAFGNPSFAGKPENLFLRDSLVRRRLLASQLARRGHLREASALHGTFGASFGGSQWFDSFVSLALLGAVPPERAGVVFRSALRHARPPNLGALVSALPWWHVTGDTASLTGYAAALEKQLRDGGDNPTLRATWRYGAAATRSYLALGAGDTATALRGFASLPDNVCSLHLIQCDGPHLTEARLLAATGAPGQAAELMDRWGNLEPLTVLARARIAERAGDLERAATFYAYLTATWRHADPELRPYLEEARAALVRLRSEPTGSPPAKAT